MADDPSEKVLYTIGHSNHEWPTFLALLQRHGVTAVVDVRSHPSSRLPHFRRAALERGLNEAGLAYLFLGRELGARRDEPDCYIQGCAVYERVSELPLFRQGMARLLDEVGHRRMALMCAEKEPLDCHRTILICRQLRLHPVAIRHILADGKVEDHAETERRLIRLTDTGPTLLDPVVRTDELLDRAYVRRGLKLAYRKPDCDPAQAAAR